MPSAAQFRLDPLLARFVPAALARVVAPPLERVLSLRRLERAYDEVHEPATDDPLAFARRAIDYLKVRFETTGALDEVPASGGLIVVANHPFGGIEGLYLYALLASRRADTRILGNRMLARVPELAPVLFPVDILSGRAAAVANATAMRRAVRWVADGGILIVFPAGEVSTLDPISRTVVDRAWQPSVARLVSLAKAPVLPVYFDGGNSPLFHAAGLIHPRLRTALLPRELLNKRNRRIGVRVGRLITLKQVQALNGDGPLIEHLRLRVYALAGELPDAPAEASAARAEAIATPALAELAPPVPAAALAAEIAALDPARRLAAAGDLEVWFAAAADVPRVLKEIGRLRELTFRAVGEGTGHAEDIDLYDRYYDQLFVWNRTSREIVGGYRIGQADRIVERYGPKGLYTSTLFRFHRALLPSLGAALELGRSFVRPEYQRSFAPLLLLWKGIAAYVVLHPRYHVLFGPVSISNDYTLASKALLTGFLRSKHADDARGGLARARNPLSVGLGERLVRREGAEVGTLEALEAVLTSIETDGKGVPVLLRQYLKLGARVLAFNVDPAFGHSIDVLVATDLVNIDAKVLAKYMGREAAEAYLAGHGCRLPVTAP
jgi:putative hemolysin